MGFLDGDFHIHHGDTIPHMHDLPEACMDFLVTSVPFPSVYAYTSLGEDIGNSEDLQGEAKIHFSYFFRAARRIMKPGRVVMIDWAECTWSDIKETSTLNKSEGRGEQDTKHICPLQLPLLNRLIRLYTNPGEVVFDPFSGIGSTGYEALKLGRRYYGSEIKNEY